MKKIFIHYSLFIIAFAFSMAMTACNTTEPEPQGTTITFTPSDSVIANPERGVFAQIYYSSKDLDAHANPTVINNNRSTSNKMTIYLHSYYLTDYMESDIPQAFLDRLETNMNALREGGGKAVIRFSYKSSMDSKDKPWDASPQWIHRHIDQLTPYLQKHADVIMCMQCGFIGSWGEWYYTSGFKMNPTKDADFVPRWEVLEHVLRALPETRQVALRTPGYKMRYLAMHGDTTMSPLNASEAFQPTVKARLAGHNDCFVSSSNDVGTFGVTYSAAAERAFWAEDTKYMFMGGETCEKCSFSNGTNALSEMEKYHWTYINRDYRETVTNMWRKDGTMTEMLKRLGYRLVLDKAILTPQPKAGEDFKAYFVLNNVGFAAPINKRDLELVFVNLSSGKKHIFPQTAVDPRFWLPGEEHRFTLTARLNDLTPGKYKLYLNLPDPYPTLHNDPRYSIRLANENVWEEKTGYNYIATITIE